MPSPLKVRFRNPPVVATGNNIPALAAECGDEVGDVQHVTLIDGDMLLDVLFVGAGQYVTQAPAKCFDVTEWGPDSPSAA